MTKRIARFLQKVWRRGVVLKTLGTVLHLLLYILYYGLYPLWWIISKWLVFAAQVIRSDISFKQFARQLTKLWLLSALLTYAIVAVGAVGYAIIYPGVSVWEVIKKFPLLIVDLIQFVDEETPAFAGTLGIICFLLGYARFRYRKKSFPGWLMRFIDLCADFG